MLVITSFISRVMKDAINTENRRNPVEWVKQFRDCKTEPEP